MQEEVWKQVKLAQTGWEISNKGRLRYGGRIMRDFDGAVSCNIKNTRGSWTTRTICRMVAEAFIPNPQGFKYVVKKDESRGEDVDNIAWSIYAKGISTEKAEKKIGRPTEECICIACAVPVSACSWIQEFRVPKGTEYVMVAIDGTIRKKIISCPYFVKGETDDEKCG